MRSWNFVTFDQISGRVTSDGKSAVVPQNARRRANFRSVVPAIVVSTLILASAPTSQVQPFVSGTAPNVKLSVETIASSAPLRPPYSEKLSKFFDKSFIAENAEALRSIAQIGSSVDSIDHLQGIASAVQDSEDKQEWIPSV